MVKKNQRRNNILILFALIAAFLSVQESSGQENYPFTGQVNSDEINIRSDSTVSSAAICQLNKGEEVTVVSDAYGWYKISLPKKAPSFIKANLITPIDEKTAKVNKTNVNIRFEAGESSPVIGQADLDEIINILEKVDGWYKIEPVKNSFGWIYSKFVDKKDISQKIAAAPLKDTPTDTEVTLEGIIKPYGKVIKRQATHKLITQGNQIYLLKGNKATLNTLNHRKVKISGKLITAQGQKYSIIEISQIISE